MKKIGYIVAIVFTLFLGNSLNASAEESYFPDEAEIEAMNLELKALVEEANKQLENGAEKVEVTSGNVTLFFEAKENRVSPFLKEGSVSATSTVGSKSYQAYVANTLGFNFRHAVSGTFSWNSSGQLTGLTAVPDLSGAAYSRTETTTKSGVDGILGRDAKIAEVYSRGTFTPLKWSPKSYYTTIIVNVYGPTQEYRIMEAKIDY
ncbi:hypothetical protein [Sporosarcina sp. USHLN248]|uniref:hypothetical protein n=1 Tax=Sporosarcina sp. USHLN248 TaxID=3081300 RepID=UPI003019A80D